MHREAERLTPIAGDQTIRADLRSLSAMCICGYPLSMSDKLPSFKNPPVVETVLGVNFAQLAGFQIPHFGLYWQRIREEFTRCQVQPLLIAEIEQFESAAESPSAILIPEIEVPRCWYVSQPGNSLIQLQRDWFLFNWRKISLDAEYPRYSEFVRPSFEKQFAAFLSFLHDEGLGPIAVSQCEATYINHIPKGAGWESIKDWPSVFPILSNTRSQFLPVPESGRFTFNYLFQNPRGRLKVSLQPAVRKIDSQEILVLTLTVRGQPTSSSTPDILAWMDAARERIVRGFADFTSERMQRIWKREQ